jgi:methylated-DNA-protein-cysteine methyltransferase related protein
MRNACVNPGGAEGGAREASSGESRAGRGAWKAVSAAGRSGGAARTGLSGNGRAARAVDFTARVKAVLRAIPRGRIVSYGQVAQLAGNPGASRQVVRILHTCAGPERLPWHRVLRKNGEIALPPGRGGEEQRARLEEEGVEFGFDDRVDLDRFAWRPRRAIKPVSKVAGQASSDVRSKSSRKV